MSAPPGGSPESSRELPGAHGDTVALADTVTMLDASHRGRVLVTGSHGGLIDFESEPGRTVFRVLLPIEP